MTDPKPSKSKILTALQSTLDQGVEAGAPGFSAAIGTSKAIPWQSTAGFADILSSKSLDLENTFGIGSITKVFVAVVIFQLIDAGSLKITTKLGDLLPPDILHGIDNAAEATIGRLLSHTSGVDTWELDPKWIREGRGQDLDPKKIWRKTETLDYVRRPNPEFPPPGTWRYSNTNYTFLGLVIENITGNKAESEIRERILELLGMEDTFLGGFEEKKKGKLPHRYHWITEAFLRDAGVCPAFSYTRPDLIDATGSNLSVSWTAGGMISSPTDLLKFAVALRDGKLVSPESLAVMQSWQPAEGQEMGHGLFRMHFPKSHGNWIGHFGSVLGFTAGLLWHEEKDVVISVLSNVGTVHCGEVPSHAGTVVKESEFLRLAVELTECEG